MDSLELSVASGGVSAAILSRGHEETVDNVALESGQQQSVQQSFSTAQESVSCDSCEKSAVKSCLDCVASYCEDHVKRHLTVPKLRKHKLVAPTRDLDEGDSEEHEGEEIVCENQIQKTEMATSDGRQERLEELMKNSHPVVSKTRKVFLLTTEQTVLNDTVRRWTFGERDDSKKNKIIMLVGETGTGKTTLINTLVNHALNVRFDDNVWFEISKEENSTKQTDSQTTHVTVYDVFVKENPFSLTIIDTPGYGDTRGLHCDQLITENLLKLFRVDNGVHEVDAICLILKASMNRLTTTQHYIFNAVLSLFGKDVQGNIVLLITHSNGESPRNALKAVQEGKIPCARNHCQEPIYFLFDNCQLSEFEEESKSSAERSWIRGVKSIERLYEFIEKQERKSMELTTGVLKERVQLQACVNNLVQRLEWIELKQQELKQTQVAIEENKEKIQACENFTYQVEVPYKEKENIQKTRFQSLEGPHGLAYYADILWDYFDGKAVCCTVCEENCHHPGCWLAFSPEYCEVMENQHCTSCTNKCHYEKHVKGNQLYVTKTRMETKTNKDLKRQFEAHSDLSKYYGEIMRKLHEDLQKATAEKCRIVHKAYECIMKLQEIALAKESVFTLVYLDFLIEKMDEMKDTEKAGKLKEMQKKKAVKQSTLEYVAALLKIPFRRFLKKK